MKNTSSSLYQNIGIIGGGTAGYFTALAIKNKYPDTEVTLIESDKIPVIGVGESTTRVIINFLHKDLGFSFKEFFDSVQPTWKLGIRFEWGGTDSDYFNYPFEKHDSYGAVCLEKDINLGSLGSILMNQRKSFLYEKDGNLHSLGEIGPKTNYAYHLDNVKLINFLKEKAKERSVKLINSTIQHCELEAENGGINYLIDEQGYTHKFDIYFDCTGFRSSLLGTAMKSPHISFANSLFTDMALTGHLPHYGNIKPYTTAKAMDAGWMWNIPLQHEDHLGYVFSSRFYTEEQAQKELESKFPGVQNTKIIKFTSGRRADCWRKNVIGVGNSYAFIEPLESTGIQMIISTIRAFINEMENDDINQSRAFVNKKQGEHWDHLKWFLTWHFKFNKKINTPFWEAKRNEADASGYNDIFEFYKKNGPFRKPAHFHDQHILGLMKGSLFRFNGFDNILMGQEEMPESVDKQFLFNNSRFLTSKVKLWSQMSALALTQKEAFERLNNLDDLEHLFYNESID